MIRIIWVHHAAFSHSDISQETTDQPHQTQLEYHQRPLRTPTPRLEVPIFHGEGAVGWLYQLNHYFMLHNTPPDQMLELAPLFMTGDALLWYQWKDTTGQISSWKQLAEDIKKCFGPIEYYDVEVAINHLVQTSSVQAYCPGS